MKIVTIKGLWLLHWCTKFHIDIWSRLWVIGVWNIENRTRRRTHADTHTRIHIHASRRQLKMKFLDVLDYYEYSDTNISKFFFHQWGSKSGVFSKLRPTYWIHHYEFFKSDSRFVIGDHRNLYTPIFLKFFPSPAILNSPNLTQIRKQRT